MEKNRKDKDSKFRFTSSPLVSSVVFTSSPLVSSVFFQRLILVESKIHRLARYYRRTKQLPANWKYQSANAAAIVS